jgi:heterodisulfide reductase subunit A
MSETIAVIGGGPAGLEAARGAAELGGSVVLIEKESFLGGTPIRENYAALTPHMQSAEEAMGVLIDGVTSQPGAEVLLEHEVTACEGEGPDFRLTVKGPGGERVIECGSIIVATGFEHFDPGRETQLYGYYEHPDVLALQDLEAMLKDHNVVRPSNGLPPERICFVQCVGSRDRHIGNEYCSKVCCGVASKEAIEVRQLLPDCKVFIFYIDMRMYGYWENQIYWPAQEEHHVQYIKGIITEVLKKGDKLLVRGEDTTMGRILGIEPTKYGFINAVKPPLDTVSTSRPGIFACGASLGPADLEDCASSGGAAAMKALTFLRRKPVAVA